MQPKKFKGACLRMFGNHSILKHKLDVSILIQISFYTHQILISDEVNV